MNCVPTVKWNTKSGQTKEREADMPARCAWNLLVNRMSYVADPAFSEGKDEAGKAQSVAFWAVHALSV